jgi:hypothetical protein
MKKTLCLAVLLSAAALSSAALAPAALAQGVPTAESLIAQADADKDGALTKAEWATLGAPVEFPEAADTTKDGKLTLAELKAFLAQFGR